MGGAAAFAPCHITGIFQIFDQSADILNAGSRGAGVSLKVGVKTTVKVEKGPRNRLKVNINHQTADCADLTKHVVRAFLSRLSEASHFEIKVEHQVEAPIGAGFGTSGAGALSLGLALNEALGLGMSKIQCAQIAHVAEIECKTGLGTVIAETFGGFEIRVKPGAPGIGEIKCLPIPENAVVACHVFGPERPGNSLANKQAWRGASGRNGQSAKHH
jgi:pantoate kinase